jgi:chromosome segregation ATPase
MKKTFFILSVTTALMAGPIFTGCDSSDKKVEDAQNKVQDAKQDLAVARKDSAVDALKTVTAEEWKIFRDESERKIKNNEIRIDELKAKIKKEGKELNTRYEARMDTLELRNKEMKARMDAYEKRNGSDWETFKQAFNHDMGVLGYDLKDLTTSNKK